MPPVFPAHWHVSQPVLIADTFSSLVWKVSLPDGTPAIVKGLKPIEDIADELRGADYLVWRNGRGAVRLLGRENNLMLLEYAGERMLSHRHCCKVSDEAAFCLIQRPYISKTLLTRRISPRGSP